jgi:hypothetical protein
MEPKGEISMPGKKFGFVLSARVPGSYYSLSEAEREAPGRVFEELLARYAGKVDFLRRYWTSAFSAEVSDVFVMECDDPMDMHSMVQELNNLMAKDGDPERFGKSVSVIVGVNPDAG